MKVVSLAPMWRDELAAALGGDIEFVALDSSADAALRERELANAQIVLTTQLGAELARHCKSLELVICPAAGTEGIDRAALPAGVPVVNGTGHEIPMAEYIIGALVALRQRFQAADAALRKGTWRFGYFGTREPVDELSGSTLGIIGFGRIGQEVARRAVAFGVACRAATMHPDKPVEAGLLRARPGALAESGDVDALVASSDALVIACEHSPLTHGLIDARRLRMMPAHALLINVARGPIVDEKALYDALAAKTIAAAAIDVWYRYPEAGADAAQPSAYPFYRLENVLMTPHSSGWTHGAKRRKLAFLARTIGEWRARRRAAT